VASWARIGSAEIHLVPFGAIRNVARGRIAEFFKEALTTQIRAIEAA